MPDIVVLNGSAHGIPSSECADALRDHLSDDDRTVGLAESPAAEPDLVRDADVIVGGDLRPEVLEAAEELQLFACSSAGVGHLDLEAFEERGIAVTNASGVHGPNIAEHVLGWILLITRRLDEGIRRQNRREWNHFQAFGELQGSRVCVVGLGAIGQAIVDRLEGFGVETVGVRYTPEKGGPTDEVYGFDEMSETLVGVDYLVVACPLTDETRGLIGADELATLPPDAVVVNVGRGPIVDTDALLSALRGNKLHAAALDVTDPEPLPEEHPLWNLENVYITPHNSGHTPHYWERVADILVRNLERVDERGSFDDLENQVA
ncbi:D-2-hydroxyacid dehydrogenase [Halobacteria archaeon AArc-m2/3/4]|uniref:D-2-hydroxyacid dehydrogenase n=1 Tax=Natronoglomus mannanivorans TaxID=2979990 RepID=A0AAP2YZA9_9EURY|nr:D-2-hydroxyacid dehydrogenase [Halobacteria archaeon AArc-xg1-1]MCU4971320.1 D-2-hydroxyacid dehydrogenase [Halobacteria archaeon AArc-m2/3/4]